MSCQPEHVLTPNAGDSGSGYPEVLRAVLTAAARWGMWELVGYVARQVGAASAPAAPAAAAPAAAAAGMSEGRMVRNGMNMATGTMHGLQQQPQQQEQQQQEEERKVEIMGAEDEDVEQLGQEPGQRGAQQEQEEHPTAKQQQQRTTSSSSFIVERTDSSSDSSSVRADVTSQGIITTTSNADDTSSTAPTSFLALPSVRQLFYGGFWPQEVEQQYLAFKHSQLLSADIITLAYFINVCLSVLSDRPGNRISNPGLDTSSTLLSPAASRYYMAAICMVPCVLLLLPRLLGRVQYREGFALGCVAAGPMLSVPLAAGWTVPTRMLLEATHVGVVMELMSVVFNGFIRPFAYQVNGYGEADEAGSAAAASAAVPARLCGCCP